MHKPFHSSPIYQQQLASSAPHAVFPTPGSSTLRFFTVLLGLAIFFVPRGWIRARNGRAASFHGPRALQHTCILDTSRRFFPHQCLLRCVFARFCWDLPIFSYPRVGSGPVMAARPHHIARAPPRDGWRNSCARAGLGAAGRRVDRRWLGEPPAVGKTAGCRGNRPWRFWYEAQETVLPMRRARQIHRYK